jgi:DNA-binding transcriptional MerR regulator
MPESPPIVPTVGSIAERLGVPVHRIRYVIESRRIEPTGRAGNARIFTDSDVERIASELKRIEREREGGHE